MDDSYFEIVQALTTGATLVLLQPCGQLDIAYLSRTMRDKEISSLITSATITRLLTDYATTSDENGAFLRHIRVFSIAGKIFCKIFLTESSSITILKGANLLTRQVIVLARLMEKNFSKARIVNYYGLTECLGLTGYRVNHDHLLSINDMKFDDVVPIGRPLPGRICFLIDSSGQLVTSNNVMGVIYVNGKLLTCSITLCSVFD